MPFIRELKDLRWDRNPLFILNIYHNTQVLGGEAHQVGEEGHRLPLLRPEELWNVDNVTLCQAQLSLQHLTVPVNTALQVGKGPNWRDPAGVAEVLKGPPSTIQPLPPRSRPPCLSLLANTELTLEHAILDPTYGRSLDTWFKIHLPNNVCAVPMLARRGRRIPKPKVKSSF